MISLFVKTASISSCNGYLFLLYLPCTDKPITFQQIQFHLIEFLNQKMISIIDLLKSLLPY